MVVRTQNVWDTGTHRAVAGRHITPSHYGANAGTM